MLRNIRSEWDLLTEYQQMMLMKEREYDWYPVPISDYEDSGDMVDAAWHDAAENFNLKPEDVRVLRCRPGGKHLRVYVPAALLREE